MKLKSNMQYTLKDFDYYLPSELIAQEHAKPRDHSRLLILDKKSGQIEHKNFFNIIDFFKKGDLLVLNNSKVFPARLNGIKAETGGKIEVFMLSRQLTDRDVLINKEFEDWQCLLGGRGARPGLKIILDERLSAEVVADNHDGTWIMRFDQSEKKLMATVNRIGQMPLPPYIKKLRPADKKNYQTVYADKKKTGSVAAPTAGLHFTSQLLKKLAAKGVQIEYVTLHVGLGTFAPVKVDDITKHQIHSEWAEIKAETIKEIVKAKKEKRRIIAVGTTAARTLESAFQNFKSNNPKDYSAWVNIFIYPGYQFKIVDGLVTNFHLPKSTLVMLVSALAGKKNIDKVYAEAINKKYRFYSYGDAMLIL